MPIVIDGLRACYLAISLCAGVPHPPPLPSIHIVANEVHVTGGRERDGFACGEYLDGSTAYCAGESWHNHVQVSTMTLNALPHELLHHIIEHRVQRDGDPDHGLPFWQTCVDRKDRLPACAGLWR